MKKLILPVMAMLLCMTACKKEENGILTLEAETYSSDAKLHIDNLNYAVWDNGDKVYLNGSSDPTTVTVDNTNHKATISTAGYSISSGSYASYPYRMQPTATTGVYKMTLPMVQTYRENENHEQVVEAPMAAYYGNDGVLRFHNLGTLLAVTVTNNTAQSITINRIEVFDLNITPYTTNTPLSGTANIANIDTENPTMVINSSIAGSKSYVALECNSHILTVGSSKTYYIALPVLNNAKLKVKVFTDESYVYTMKQNNSTITLARNTIQDVPFSATDGIKTKYFRALKGKFQVNASGKKVRFSCGILQCDATASPLSWSFADNQLAGSTTFSASNIQHFYWGNSTKNYGTNYTDMPNAITFNVTSNETVVTDHWGEIAESNTTAGADWQTLTKDEWDYLLNTRSGATVYWNETPVANSRWMTAKVNGSNGLILFPDTNRIDISINRPNYTADSWNDVASFTTTEFSQFEAAGCVFLKGGIGKRSQSIITSNNGCSYRTSTPSSSNSRQAYLFSVAPSSTRLNLDDKVQAYPVRLVQVVE